MTTPATVPRPSPLPGKAFLTPPEWLLVASCATGLVAFILPWWTTAQRWAFWQAGATTSTSGLSLATRDGRWVLVALPAMFAVLILVLLPIRRATPMGAARWSRLPLAAGAALTAVAGLGVAAGDQVVAFLTVANVVEVRLGMGGVATLMASMGVLAAGWWMTGRYIDGCGRTTLPPGRA